MTAYHINEEFDNIPETKVLKVGDILDFESIGPFTVEYVQDLSKYYIEEFAERNNPIVVLSEETDTGLLYLALNRFDGDWDGCCSRGDNVIDALSNELLRLMHIYRKDTK